MCSKSNSTNKVWVNGCFDILHEGHLDLLEYAASFGELHVGIDADSRVKELKGLERPVNSQQFRWRMLSSLKYVNSCYIFFSSRELENIIRFVKPTILVIGDDYRDAYMKNNNSVIGASYVNHIMFYPHTKNFSTTNFIENLKK